MYIVFEGIVGSGKTTQVKKLVEYLSGIQDERFRIQNKEFINPKILHVREPGSTPISEDIRYLAQGKVWEDATMYPLTNAYLYAAARAQTLHTIVKPALAGGNIVISDRSFLSSCAYQGEAQGLGINTILEINKTIIEGMIPDIVFYMDISIESALSRTFDQGGDKWETMGKVFFEKIIEGYEKCEKLDIMKNRFIRIDANGTEDQVFAKILQLVEKS